MKTLGGIGRKDLFPVLWLTVVVAIAVTSLALTDMVTRDLIEEAREDEIKAMLEELFPEMDAFEEKDDIYFILRSSGEPEGNPYGIDGDHDIIGFAFLAEGDGYGGTIELLIGIGPDIGNVTLVGLEVISHSETPGLGARLTEDAFIGQFEGVPLGDAVLEEDGGEIDAISGATITSRAVVDAVQDAVDSAVQRLEGMTEGGS